MRISDEKKRDIRHAYYRLDWPVRKICREFDISFTTVYNVIPRSHRRGKKLPDKIGKGGLDVIATMNYRGYTDGAIARKLGVTRSAVTKQRNRLGIKAIPAGFGKNRIRETW